MEKGRFGDADKQEAAFQGLREAIVGAVKQPLVPTGRCYGSAYIEDAQGAASDYLTVGFLQFPNGVVPNDTYVRLVHAAFRNRDNAVTRVRMWVARRGDPYYLVEDTPSPAAGQWYVLLKHGMRFPMVEGDNIVFEFVGDTSNDWIEGEVLGEFYETK